MIIHLSYGKLIVYKLIPVIVATLASFFFISHPWFCVWLMLCCPYWILFNDRGRIRMKKKPALSEQLTNAIEKLYKRRKIRYPNTWSWPLIFLLWHRHFNKKLVEGVVMYMCTRYVDFASFNVFLLDVRTVATLLYFPLILFKMFAVIAWQHDLLRETTQLMSLYNLSFNSAIVMTLSHL